MTYIYKCSSQLSVLRFLCTYGLHLPPYQVLGGHEGPVSCLCFSPVQSILASASWDRTIRLWDMLDSWQVKETLHLTSDGKYRCHSLM